MRRAALLASFLAASPVGAQSLSLSDDFATITRWLTNETSQGLAFYAGSTFDPPSELRPWSLQPDVSLGLGVFPLNKKRFPALTVPALIEKDPAGSIANQMLFPDTTLHLRLGLPGRWDVSGRAQNTTIPKGYKVGQGSRAQGQSNALGFGVRRHFFGGEKPLLSLAANYNHVFGHTKVHFETKQLEIAEGFVADSVNTTKLLWDVSSLGFNAVVSKTLGVWTPFFGAGYNRMGGSVHGKLRAEYDTALIIPPTGEASDRPQEHQARLILGAQLDRSHFGLFLNGEVKAIGVSAGKTFIVTTGLVAPLGIGAAGVVRRSAAPPRLSEAGRSPTDIGSGISSPYGSVTLPRDSARSAGPETETALAGEVRPASAGNVRFDPGLFQRTKRSDKEPPELIFIR